MHICVYMQAHTPSDIPETAHHRLKERRIILAQDTGGLLTISPQYLHLL